MVATTRVTSIAIDLGGEQIELAHVEASEALGRPFAIEVDLLATLGELDLMPHLGKAATITITEDGELQRYFNGILVEGEFLTDDLKGQRYRLSLRPWTHLLAHNLDYRIFQGKTALQIIAQVLSHHSFAAIDQGGVSSSPPVRDYCVQYGESDFAFISRLLEEEGIYYYFEHKADRHIMKLVDAPGGHKAGRHPRLIFNPIGLSAGAQGTAATSSQAARHMVHSWSERVVSGSEALVSLRDFDFEKPQRPIAVSSHASLQHPNDALEVYGWRGANLGRGKGQTTAQAILDARRAGRKSYAAESQDASLTVGSTFTLADHPTKRFNASYLITRTHHLLSTDRHHRGGEGGTVTHIEAIPAATRFQGAHVTPRPMVRGPETAIVTGPAGETIFTDKYGRVKVRFHWDRGDGKDEESTCWIRVSQTGGLGNIILPRVGHEVLVDFLDGDPDRPLVVGRVFNADHMPIYQLPKNKTRALWRTKTYGDQAPGSYGKAEALDTGAPQANELRFEDRAGEEEVFLHAERDMNVRVRFKETHHIGLDQEWKIGGARTTTIKETDSLDVKKSITIKSGTDIVMEAIGSITLKVGQTSIKLDPKSITIGTTMLTVDAKATAELKSAMTTVKGDGVLTLKGGMTMIN